MTNEEAIDLLDNLIGMIEDNHNSDYDTAFNMAIKALEQNESAEEWYKLFVEKLEQEPKTGHWIPVTESTPELGVKVLVQREFGKFDIGYYDGCHEREYWKNGTKHTETVPYWWYIGGRLSVNNPIAWIPIPQPYKPQKSEDKE